MLKNDLTICASSFTLMKVPVDMEGVSFRVGDRLRAERERERQNGYYRGKPDYGPNVN